MEFSGPQLLKIERFHKIISLKPRWDLRHFFTTLAGPCLPYPSTMTIL